MKKISIVIPTFNEQDNILDLLESVKKQFINSNYDYEIIVIDNSSTDNTINILRHAAQNDKRIKVIINIKNFGHIRSHVYGLFQSSGDATIFMMADFQDPPELIPQYIKLWESGNAVVFGQKIKSKEFFLMRWVRNLFYTTMSKISKSSLTKNTTGSGIYDRKIIDKLRKIQDPYPYLRGLVTEITSEIKLLQFNQPQRRFGVSKNNIFTLLDMALAGLIKHSNYPIRILVILGIVGSFLSIFLSIIFFVYKLLFWESFPVGIAPLVIGFFAFASFQFLFLGIIGEYISMILSHTRNIPLVYEKERINFD